MQIYICISAVVPTCTKARYDLIPSSIDLTYHKKKSDFLTISLLTNINMRYKKNIYGMFGSQLHLLTTRQEKESEVVIFRRIKTMSFSVPHTLDLLLRL